VLTLVQAEVVPVVGGGIPAALHVAGHPVADRDLERHGREPVGPAAGLPFLIVFVSPLSLESALVTPGYRNSFASKIGRSGRFGNSVSPRNVARASAEVR